MVAYLTTAELGMSDRIVLKIQVPEAMGKNRLDQVAADLFSEYSRSRLQSWIKDGLLLVDGKPQKTRAKLIGGEWLTLDAPIEAEGDWIAQDIPIDVVYVDDDIIVINKQAGLVVHPGAGNPDGTLINALLFHFPDVINVPRAGIVHRLDKDTTGLMVVARNLIAHASLVDQLQKRTVGREYEAVCHGEMTGGGTVDEPMARHNMNRLKMAVHPMGKTAITHYRLVTRFRQNTHIRVKLETGRTHQIRVHMAHLRHPLVGDTLYGGRQRMPGKVSPDLQDAIRAFPRQALHAQALTLIHPRTGDTMRWEVPLPDDFVTLLQALADDVKDNDPF
jgi:23S rRNA pseudouridine1911/1915/1917 synthase